MKLPKLENLSSGWAVLVLLLLSLIAALVLSLKLNVWIDECFTLLTTDKGLSYAIKRAISFESQPPLYYQMLWLWRTLNGSVFFARLFSVLCVSLTGVVLWRLSLRFFQRIRAAWIIAIFIVNPFTIWAATEIRLYAFLIFLSSLLLLFFYDGYIAEPVRKKARWWYVLFSILSLYTQYYAGFLLVAHGAALLCLRRWKDLRDYLLRMIVVGVCFLPMVVVVKRGISQVKSVLDSPVASPVLAVRMVIWHLTQWILPAPDKQDWLLTFRPWVLILCAAGICYLVLSKFRRIGRPKHVLLWTAIVVPAAFFAVISMVLSPDLIWIHHCSVLFLPTLMGAFALLEMAESRAVLRVWVILVMVFCASTLWDTYRIMAKGGDWIRVASYIRQSEKPAEPIAVFRSEFSWPFRLYYTGVNAVVPLPAEPNPERYDQTSQVLNGEKQIEGALREHLGDSHRLWLVTVPNRPFRGTDFHPQILEDYVDKRCRVLERRDFYGSTVRLLMVKPAAKTHEEN